MAQFKGIYGFKERIIEIEKFPLFIALINLMFTSHIAQAACSCPPERANWKLIATSRENVFSAKVIELDKERAVLQKDHIYRGKAEDNFVIRARKSECALPLVDFKKGETYLFAVSANSHVENNKSELNVDVCDWPSNKSTSPELVKWLNSKEFKNVKPEKK